MIKMIIITPMIIVMIMKIQEVKLSAALEVKQGVGDMMNGLIEGIQNKTNRLLLLL